VSDHPAWSPDPRVAPAAARFGDDADRYDRARPGYPETLLDLLAVRTGLGEGTAVLDLAAGTGKLTRQLVARGADVVAVEPSPGMRDRLTAALPGVRVEDGTAEDLPLADGAVDLVTVGQAFHWFDTRPALAEIHRVLRPGGWLALLWNEPPPGGWAAELWDLRHELTGFTPASYPGDGWAGAVDADPGFGDRAVTRVTVEVATSAAAVLDDSASRSYVHVLDPDDRTRVLERLADFLADHPETAGRDRLIVERPCVLHLVPRVG
jgi:SAM-dependent methyltransferase